MNISYLIDADWVIHYLNDNEKIVNKLISLKKEGLSISVISLAELYDSRENKRKVLAGDIG